MGHAGFPVYTPGNVDPYGSGQPLPQSPARQLTGNILRSYDTVALDAIQAEADSFPYNGSVKARNALFLETELRSGSMLTGFLGGARVTTLLDGQIDLNEDPGTLSWVSNGVFFTAIRTAWANYQSLSSTLAAGPAATGVVALRNPDVARLEEWEPQAYLGAMYSMPMALDHSVIADLRQRTRESGQLSQWQEEGNIVEFSF
jgi:hypothetical protein